MSTDAAIPSAGCASEPASAPYPASGLVITQITCQDDLEKFLPSLRRLLLECVNVDPASSALCFLAPISDDNADAYWRSLWPHISATPPLISLFVLTRGTPEVSRTLPNVIGTVHLASSPKQTHAHKAEVLKLLVSSAERGSGLGHLLMRHLEDFARDTLGKSVLLLDTATATPARAFYLKSGWTEWGVCPSYAAYADGTLGDCSFFVKQLKPLPPGR